MLTTARAEAVGAMELLVRDKARCSAQISKRAITCSSSVDRGAKPPHYRP